MVKLVLFLLVVGLAASAFGDKILVLIDNPTVKESHSTYFKSLESRGHVLDIQMADDASLSLIKYGEFLYQHLIILAPLVEEFGGSISVPEIVKFIDGGGNVLIAAASNIGDAIRDLAAEVGFEFDEEKSEVIDHKSFDSALDKGQHNVIVVPSSQLIDTELIAGNKAKTNAILYRGTSLLTDTSNNLCLEVLKADSTAASTSSKSTSTGEGDALVLVGAMQARNNARVVISGSIELFSNTFLNGQVSKSGASPTKSGNLDFVTSLSKWAFKEAGVLRVQYVKHSKVGETSPPEEYTIMDDVKYEIGIEELKDGKWVPFQRKDVQLEFVRIDPFVRTTLQNKGTHFTTTFKVPDVYGVFKFLIDYNRVGYTFFYDVRQVSVRPFTHTQYERFSRCAFPYYVSAFSMMIGVYIFSFVFLYYKDSTPDVTTPAQKLKTK